MAVGIMVALPSDIVNLCLRFWDVWPKYLPVVAAVFKLDFSVKFLGQVLADARRSSKESRTRIPLPQNVFHLWALAVEEVHIRFRKSTIVEHSDPLLERERCARIWLDHRLVAHEESTHHLQNWYLNREVEWSDYANSAIWPSVPSCKLAGVITWIPRGLSQEPNVIATKVFEEGTGNTDFTCGLFPTFRNTSHHAVDKEVERFLLVQYFSCFAADVSEHEVPFFVFEGVMQATLWYCQQALDKWIYFFRGCLRYGNHGLARQWINQLKIFCGGRPLPVYQVHAFVLGAQVGRVKRGKVLQVLRCVPRLNLDYHRFGDCRF